MRVREAGFDGMAIDLGAMDIEAARALVPEFARTGLAGLLTAFPRSIEELRPALHLAKDIGAPFVIVVGQVMPLRCRHGRGDPRLAAGLRRGGLPLQFETHRNCITNDLFSTLLLLEAIPDMRLSADLSHYVVDREMMQPITADYQAYVERILERSDSFQGRVATRCQVQLPLHFPQHRVWIDTFRDWWRARLRLVAARTGRADCIFLCELGPAITPSPARTARNFPIAGGGACPEAWAREYWAAAGEPGSLSKSPAAH